MKDLAEISSRLGVELIISDGSLLQLYRNCSLGESDLDFLVPLSWWNTANSQNLRAALKEANFENTKVFGQLGHVGYEEAWSREGVKARYFSLVSTDLHMLQVDLFSSTCSTETNLCSVSLWVRSKASACSFPFQSIR